MDDTEIAFSTANYVLSLQFPVYRVSFPLKYLLFFLCLPLLWRPPLLFLKLVSLYVIFSKILQWFIPLPVSVILYNFPRITTSLVATSPPTTLTRCNFNLLTMVRQQFTHLFTLFMQSNRRVVITDVGKNTSQKNCYLCILLLIPGQFIIFFIYCGCRRTTTFQSGVINKDTADIYV